jgi:hypothetical protein
MIVVLQQSTQAREATMKALIGGRDAPRRIDHRHVVLQFIIPFLAPLGDIRTRSWTPLTVATALILMSWDPAPTLAQRFDAAFGLLRASLPRRRRLGRTYQGFVKAMMRHGDEALALVVAHLQALTKARAGAAWTLRGLIPIGVDGSMFDAPRTIANEALGFANRAKCGPQIRSLLLVHLGAMLPWSFELGEATTSERTLLRRVLGVLPANTLLVADAGFVGFDLMNTLRGRGIHFLIRVGRGVHLLRELGYYRCEGKNTVYLWPKDKRQQRPLVLRLIRVGSVYLVTDITDPKQLSKSAAGELYRRRWGLEVAFRSLKQTLERRKVRSGAAAHAMMELKWAFAGVWMLSLIGAAAIARAKHTPSRLSLARVLSALRAARTGTQSRRQLCALLRHAVLDRYKRRGSKKAYRWPHKKNPPPPGVPTVTTATRAETQLARALRSSKTAA